MAKKDQLTTSDYLPYAEYERLLKCFREDKLYFWELYARLSFCTACRSSDVRALKWSDVLGKNYLSVKEKKTGKVRPISFNLSVQKKIKELYELMDTPDVDSYIFKNRFDNEPVSIQYVNRELKLFKQKYNLDIVNFSTHTFRKTFGRYVYETNNRSAESLILLNKILNHSSIEITKTYIGITQDEVNRVFDSIQF